MLNLVALFQISVLNWIHLKRVFKERDPGILTNLRVVFFLNNENNKFEIILLSDMYAVGDSFST